MIDRLLVAVGGGSVALQHAGSLFFDKELNMHFLHWKAGFSITGPPKES